MLEPDSCVLDVVLAGRYYGVKAPRGWVEVSDTPFSEMMRGSLGPAKEDMVCADADFGDGFAPSCVVTLQPVGEGCEGEWFEGATRALLEGIPGFVLLDMGEAVDAPEGNVLLLGTYILEDESLTCMQCLWVAPAPVDYRSELVGVTVTLTCATKDFPSVGETLVQMMSSCERISEEEL